MHRWRARRSNRASSSNPIAFLPARQLHSLTLSKTNTLSITTEFHLVINKRGRALTGSGLVAVSQGATLKRRGRHSTPVYFYYLSYVKIRFNNTRLLRCQRLCITIQQYVGGTIYQPKHVNSLKMLKRVRGIKTLEKKKSFFYVGSDCSD